MGQKTDAVMSLTAISEDLTLILLPVIAALLAVVIGILIKDAATAIAKGLAFKFDPNFKEGDIVLLDGERTLIVKIGLFKSVFGSTKEDGTYCWRYIHNTRIQYLKLEKIINQNDDDSNA